MRAALRHSRFRSSCCWVVILRSTSAPLRLSHCLLESAGGNVSGGTSMHYGRHNPLLVSWPLEVVRVLWYVGLVSAF